jgi:hypothetical protein
MRTINTNYVETYQNWIKTLEGALESNTTLTSLWTKIHHILESTKSAAQEIVTKRTIDNPNSFDFTEIEAIEKVEKELRKNEIAKILLDQWFDAEDTAFEKSQNWGTTIEIVLSPKQEEVISDF